MIIIDDGSTDKSLTVVKSYMDTEKRISIHSQKNGGSAAARNNGIKRAKGQCICLLDADDRWEPTFLEPQLKFTKEKNATLVYSSHTRMDENSKEILKPYIVPKQVTCRDLLKTCLISCLTGVYDTKPFGKVYLKEEFKCLRDDYIYWLEIIKKLKLLTVIPNFCQISNAKPFSYQKKNRLIISQSKI